MAGTITHEWNGTILTITSDSGTSSCDLKGDTGDMGIRGAQGEPGIGIGIPGERGATGSKLISMQLTGQDENGGNIYTQTFDDGTTATFTAPRGERGQDGLNGSDYILTETDKNDIAGIVYGYFTDATLEAM